jgi:arylsulfatase A-like enzyme
MIESPEDLTDADVDTLITLYHGELEYVDECIANLLSTVRTVNEDTTVLFLADHGEAFGEHGRYGHPDIFYDEVIRIPMAINASDLNSGTVRTPVSCVDIVPTVLNYAGGDAPPKCAGTSLRSHAAGEDENRTVFAHATEQSDDDAIAMACDGDWKLIASAAGDPKALYHLAEDPSETENVVESELDARERLAAELSDHLNAINEAAGDNGTPIKMSEDTRNRLEKLGYVE